MPALIHFISMSHFTSLRIRQQFLLHLSPRLNTRNIKTLLDRTHIHKMPSYSTNIAISIKDTRISTNFSGTGVELAALVHYPSNFDAKRKDHYAAIVISHPGGGVKEQTAGLYARKLAETGLVTIALDASYQGASSGEPRQLDNPFVRTEDVSAVIDHICGLSYVNKTRIGAMGICAGGGFTISATIADRRIAAASTVNAVNMGTLVRRGLNGKGKDADGLRALEDASAARTADAASKKPARTIMTPSDKETAYQRGSKETWDYYWDRCKHENSVGWFTTRSRMQQATFDAFHFAESFLTQPLLVLVGSEAFSKFMSDDLMSRAASKDKRMHVVEGATHMQLYDQEEYIEEVTEQVATFFHTQL